MALDDSAQILLSLAENESTPESVLAELSDLARENDVETNDNATEPFRVIKNYINPENGRLYSLEDIVEVALDNKSNPINYNYKILNLSHWESLATHENRLVRRKIAEDSKCPQAILSKLVNDSDHKTRLAVASNMSCPIDFFTFFVNNADFKIRFAAASNSSCPSTALHILAASPFHEYRLLAVKHPNCDVNTLKKLSDDSEHTIKSIARGRIQNDNFQYL